MQEDLRPARADGRRGKFIYFDEGVLCQNRVVFPGLECKLSTGCIEYSGWYAAILAIVRRLIMEKNDLNHDGCTTMNKCSINFANVDRRKATVLLTSLKRYNETITNAHIGRRQIAPAGKLVCELICDAAALCKRLFVRDSEERCRRATRIEPNPIEADRCFAALDSANDKTVLRFCQNCDEGEIKLFKTSWDHSHIYKGDNNEFF